MIALTKRPNWSTSLPQPITIPEVITIKTLADVRKLLGHIPKERRALSSWQHVKKTLQACTRGDDPANISVALQVVLQAERVPFRVGKRTKV
jgi:hypothetical protein